MKAGAIITTLVGSILFGCSDSHSVEESVPNSGEEIQSANESAPTPKVDATEILEKELCDKGIEMGWNRERKTITVVTSEYTYPKCQSTNAKSDFIERYDFELPDNAGQCSQLAFAFWKAYANALAEIAKAVNQELSVDERREFAAKADADDAKTGGRKVSMVVNQPLYGLKILNHALATEDAQTYSCALAVQLDGEFCAMVSKGGPFRPGHLSLKQKLDKIPQDGTIGPDVFVDDQGTLWRLGIVPVDKESTGMGSEWSMRLAFEFALRMVSAEIACYQSVESYLGECNGDMITRERYLSTIRVNPTLRVEKNDSTRIRRFTLKAKHPILGEIQYKVCAIRD